MIGLYGTEFRKNGNVSLRRVDQKETLSLQLWTAEYHPAKPDALHKDTKADPWGESEERM